MFEHLDDPVPPPAGDPAAAQARGSALTRRRRLLVGGAAAGCAVVATVTGLLLTGGQPRDRVSVAPADSPTAAPSAVEEPSASPAPAPTVTAVASTPSPASATAGPTATPTTVVTEAPVPDFGPHAVTQKCGPLVADATDPVPGLVLTMAVTSSTTGEYGIGWNVRLVVRNTSSTERTFYPVDVHRFDLGQVLDPAGRVMQGGDVGSGPGPYQAAQRVVLAPGETWDVVRGLSASNGITEDSQGNPTPTGCDLRNGEHRVRAALPVGVGGQGGAAAHQVLWWPPSVPVTVVGAPSPTPTPTASASPTPSQSPTP